LKKSASPIIAAEPTAIAPARPRPSVWLAAAVVRAPSIVHSPTAKFIMREAL
jgi:hypothetical protein